jgi:hypothetical protein
MANSANSDTDAPITYSMNRWSLSRSIASDCVEVIELARSDDGEQWGMRQAADLFDERADTRRIWPFADMVDLIAVASSEADINADSITTDDVARAVSARIEESANYEYVSEPSGESDSESDSGSGSESEDDLASEIEAEADSPDSESRADGGGDASESVEDGSQGTADEQPDTAESEAEPPADISPDSADAEVDDSTGAAETPEEAPDDEPEDVEEVTAETTTSETTSDREADSDGGTETLSVAEINAAAGPRDSSPSIGNKTATSNAVAESSDAESADREQDTEQDQDTDGDEYDLLESEPEETEYEPTDQAEAIAEDLYVCFVETDPDLTYRDIRAKHDTQFPDRDAAMFEAMNSRGDTRAERLTDLAGWVDWWLEDEERLDRTNRFTPDPMGVPANN